MGAYLHTLGWFQGECIVVTYPFGCETPAQTLNSREDGFGSDQMYPPPSFRSVCELKKHGPRFGMSRAVRTVGILAFKSISLHFSDIPHTEYTPTLTSETTPMYANTSISPRQGVCVGVGLLEEVKFNHFVGAAMLNILDSTSNPKGVPNLEDRGAQNLEHLLTWGLHPPLLVSFNWADNSRIQATDGPELLGMIQIRSLFALQCFLDPLGFSSFVLSDSFG